LPEAARPATSAATVLGPLLPGEERKLGQVVDASLAETGILDEPVASGGDSGLWDGGDKDEPEKPR
jgi:hypothetical protein